MTRRPESAASEGPFPHANVAPPVVTASEMRRLDQWAVREFRLPLLVMMEHAGRALAELVVRRFRPARTDAILALVGKGGNGGGVLSAARQLLHRGYRVGAVTTEPATRFRDETARQVAMFRKEGGAAPPRVPGRALPEAALLLDGILGYGLTDAPKGAAADLIRAANEHAAPVVALDVPSGLHPDTGEAKDPTVEAEVTLALALPKRGLLEPHARPYVGELYLGDITFPRAFYEEYGTTPEALFRDGTVVRLL